MLLRLIKSEYIFQYSLSYELADFETEPVSIFP